MMDKNEALAERDAAFAERDRLREALHAIVKATLVPGNNPPHHFAIMARHRAEWPMLWQAIDAARAALTITEEPKP